MIDPKTYHIAKKLLNAASVPVPPTDQWGKGYHTALGLVASWISEMSGIPKQNCETVQKYCERLLKA